MLSLPFSYGSGSRPDFSCHYMAGDPCEPVNFLNSSLSAAPSPNSTLGGHEPREVKVQVPTMVSAPWSCGQCPPPDPQWTVTQAAEQHGPEQRG